MQKSRQVFMRFTLRIVRGVDARLMGPYRNEQTRVKAAKRMQAVTMGDQLFRLDMLNNATLRVTTFAASEIDQ